jgi:hypothetical protein
MGGTVVFKFFHLIKNSTARDKEVTLTVQTGFLLAALITFYEDDMLPFLLRSRFIFGLQISIPTVGAMYKLSLRKGI